MLIGIIAFIGWIFAWMLWRALSARPPEPPQYRTGPTERQPQTIRFEITVERDEDEEEIEAPVPKPKPRKRSAPTKQPQRQILSASPLEPNLFDHSGLRLGAAVDVETTGFAKTDEIIELAIALFAFDGETLEIRGIVDSYVGVREPGVEINRFAGAVHGMSPESLIGKTLNHLKICGIAGRAEFILAHNAPFDRRFVIGLMPEISTPWLCTMAGIDWSGFGSRRLPDLLDAHGIAIEWHHRAASDVASVLSLLSRENGGRTYFHELVSGWDEKRPQPPKPKGTARSRKKADSASA